MRKQSIPSTAQHIIFARDNGLNQKEKYSKFGSFTSNFFWGVLWLIGDWIIVLTFSLSEIKIWCSFYVSLAQVSFVCIDFFVCMFYFFLCFLFYIHSSFLVKQGTSNTLQQQNKKCLCCFVSCTIKCRTETWVLNKFLLKIKTTEKREYYIELLK